MMVRQKKITFMAQWNIGISLCHSLPMIEEFLKESRCGVLCINEGNTTTDIQIEGYVKYADPHTQHTNDKCKSMIFVRDDIQQSPLHVKYISNICLSSVRVKTFSGTTVDIINTYIQPQKEADVEALKSLLKDKESLILCGDVNAKHPLWGSTVLDARGDKISDMIIECELEILNDGSPSFFRKKLDGSLYTSHLDIIAVSKPLVDMFEYEIEDFPSHGDHARSMLIGTDSVSKSRKCKVTAWREYRRTLDEKLLSPGHEDSSLLEKIKESKEASSKWLWVKNDLASPDKGLADLIRELERKSKRAKRIGSIAAYTELEDIQNQIRVYSENLKEKRTTEFINRVSRLTSLTEVWDIANKQRTCQRPSNQLAVLALSNGWSTQDTMENVLDNLGSRLELMSQDDHEGYLKQINERVYQCDKTLEDTMRSPFTRWELDNAISEADDNSAPGPDKISNKDIKSMSDQAKDRLLRLMNDWFERGTFPSFGKLGEGVVLKKPGKDESKVESYRVIIKTSHVSKLFERLLLRRLTTVVEKKDMLADSMAAYRKLRSTHDSILDITSAIEENKLSGKSTLAVFYDISGAYNMLSHECVLHSLRAVGISEEWNFFKVIKDYLRNRRVFLRSGDEVSRERDMGSYGIPQGGVLSPLLFVLTIASVKQCIPKGCGMSNYSDDGAIYIRGAEGKVGQLDQCLLNRIVNDIVRHFNKLGLAIQPQKTVSMAFNVKRSEKLRIRINRVEIRQVDETRFLGLRLQSNGSWSSELKDIEARLHKTLAILRRMCYKAKGLSPVLALRLFKGLVISKIDYVLPYMSGLKASEAEKIDALTAKGVRTALGLPKKTSTQAALAEAGLPPAHIRGQWKLAVHLAKLHQLEHDTVTQVQTHRQASNAGQVLTLVGELFETQMPLNGLVGADLSRLCNVQLKDHVKGQTRRRGVVVGGAASEEVVRMVEVEYGGWLKVFTDGAMDDEGNGGASVVVRDLQVVRGLHINNCDSSGQAELVGVVDALRLIWRKGRGDKVVIFTDSQEAIKSIRSVDPSQEQYHLVEKSINFMNEVVKRNPRMKIVIQWCPGHCGLSENEEADLVAKAALKGEAVGRSTVNVIDAPIQLSRVKRDIKQMYENQWRKEWARDHSSLKAYVNMSGPRINYMIQTVRSRSTASMIHRIRCGAGFSDSFLGRFMPDVSVICEQCGRKNSTEHMLLSCEKFSHARVKLFMAIASLGFNEVGMRELCDEKSLKHLMEFLASSNISL